MLKRAFSFCRIVRLRYTKNGNLKSLLYKQKSMGLVDLKQTKASADFFLHRTEKFQERSS